MKNLVVISCLFLAVSVSGKQPLSQQESLQLLAPTELTLELPAEIKRQQLSKPGPAFTPRPRQIARTVSIRENLTALAPWATLGNESYSRLHIAGADAKHLSLGFDNVHLPSSADLYIIDKTSGQVLHHYTSKDVNNGSLWTPMLDTRDVLIELNVLSWQRDELSLRVRQAGFGTISVLNALQKSGSCNIDVVCPEGDNWRDVIRSVARYTIQTDTGSFVCTGSLVNNDNQDQRPLFLTAAHCLVSESTADSITVYWNYETSVCGGTPDGNLTQSQTGVNYISRKEGFGVTSDFALVELRNAPPANYGVYYSGWNAIAQNAGNVVAIHHPAGDEKRISVDADPLTITDFASNAVDESQNYYRVAAWDAGTTEGGSSGSGIWNANKEIIGTLSGGLASCDALDAPDWYGRMSTHWLGGTDASQQLATHLAPVTGNLTLAGTEPCQGADITLGTSNATPGNNEQFNFTAQVTGGTSPYTYAWDFDGDALTDSAELEPIHRYTSFGIQTARLTVTDANQCKTSATVNITVPPSQEAFVVAAEVPSGYLETPTANAGWVATSNSASEGVFSLRSEIINEFEVAAIQITDVFQNGTLTFHYRVSSEENFDFFKFYVDDVEQFSRSGEVDWVEASVSISAGTRTLKWTYEKDAGLSEGLDTAWIDEVEFVADPAPPPPPPPEPSSGGGGGSSPIWLLLSLLVYGLVRAIIFARRDTGQ